jgi:hypothetical protein
MRSRVSQLAGTDLNEVERATLAALAGCHRDLPNWITSIPSGLGRRGESRIAGARHVRLWPRLCENAISREPLRIIFSVIPPQWERTGLPAIRAVAEISLLLTFPGSQPAF